MGSGWIDALAGAMRGFWGVGMYKDEEEDMGKSRKITIPATTTMSSIADNLSASGNAYAQMQAQMSATHSQALAQQYYIGSGTQWGGIAYPGSTQYTTGAYPAPYSSEGEWGSADNQDAAGKGWMLYSGINNHPTLLAISFGTKTEMSAEQLERDVVEQAMGGCEVARKILAVLTRNRSPYAQWAKLSESLEKSA